MNARPLSLLKAVFVLGFVILLGSLAQAFPEKPITIIVPFPAGGISAIKARTIGKYLAEDFKQPVLVINRPGATGVIGTQELEKAAPDGYTLATYAISQLLTQYTSPNPTNLANVVAVSHVLTAPATITVHAALPWRNLKEFIEYARANPRKIRSANSGKGGSAHIFAEAFDKAAGVQQNHVPFAGFAPAVAAVAGGHVEATSIPVGDVASMAKAGKLRILAVAADTRHYLFPEVPTMKELHIPLEIAAWQGFIAPKGTPPSVIETLDRAIEKVLKKPEVIKTFRDMGYDVSYMNHRAFSAWLKEHDAYVRHLVESLGLRVAATK